MEVPRSLRRTVRRALVSRPALGLFAFLALTSRLPAVVDIYESPLYLALFLPSYVVSMILYDGVFGLENLVYPLQGVLPVDGHLLWEAGEMAAFYLFAVAVAVLVAAIRGRTRPPANSETVR